MNILTTADVDKINEMSYPDFVAFLGQKNTPPGGITTIKKWINLARISPSSYLLDLACSSGFSSRNIAMSVKCHAAGMDVCSSAIEIAIKEAHVASVDHLLTYQVADACHLPFEAETFTHILGGCNFAFIGDRNQALKECYRVLIPTGKLCIANFYYDLTPPEDLIDQVKEAVGFRPDSQWTYEWWNSFFSQRFSLEKEEIHLLDVQSGEALLENVKSSIVHSIQLRDCSDEVRQASLERLFHIRKILNEHRKYQKFSLSIWKK